MKRALGAAVVLTVVATGCAHRPAPASEAPPPAAVATAASAMSAGDFETARALLEPRSRCTASLDGPQAILLLSALHLDARNPRRSPAAAASNAVRYLRLPRVAAADRSLALSLFLLALELDPAAATVAGRQQSAAAAASLTEAARNGPQAAPAAECRELSPSELLPFEPPALPLRTVQQRVRSAEVQRNEATRRLRTSEDSRRLLEKQLADTVAELNRIRRILRQ